MAPLMKGAGGTNGGVGMFFAGAAMVIAGGYLLLARVSVVSGGWHFYGYNAFGLSLFPLLIGIGVLFYNGRSVPGWFSPRPGLSSSSWGSWPICTSTSADLALDTLMMLVCSRRVSARLAGRCARCLPLI